MKFLFYIPSLLFILTPLVIWVGIEMNKQADVIIHDSFIMIGGFTASPQTFAFISIFIGIALYTIGKNFNTEEKP